MTTSILLCTYNGEHFLQQQLNSYLSQTELPDELVVCDDGSTDSTIAIIEIFKANAPFPVHIYQNKTRLGHQMNFLNGLQYTSGDIVCYSDQDDIWLREKLSQLKNKFEGEHSYLHLVFSNASLIDEDNNIILPDYLVHLKMIEKWDNLNPNLRQFILKNRSFVNGCLMALSKKIVTKIVDFLKEYPTYTPPMGHDSFTAMFTSIIDSEAVREIHFPLMYHRIHNNQQIGVDLTKKQSLNGVATNKLNFYNYKLRWLTNYKDLICLVNNDKALIKQTEQNILFTKQRIKQINQPKATKIGFALKHFFSRSYHKYTQYPLKETIRDIL